MPAAQHGTQEATPEQERAKVLEEFRTELGGTPPGERSIVPQILGWSYHLTALGLAVVTIRTTALAGEITLPGVRNALAVAAYVVVGVAVDAEKPWAPWPAMAMSAATLWVLGPEALAGQPVAALTAVAHAILLVAVPAWWLRGRTPEQPG